MVKNVTPADLCLVELLDAGRTDAPPGLLRRMESRGFLSLTGSGPALTARGRRRAARLKPMEHDLRLLASAKAGGKSPLTTDGSSGFHVAGGPATIR
jgi:hypothetical protein